MANGKAKTEKPSSTGDATLAGMKRDLIVGFHVLDHDGQSSGIAGHLSARAPGAESFWSHRWGLSFAEVSAAELLESDFDLNIVAGQAPVNPTLHIHARIYAHHPDVNCIVHTHGHSVMALSAIGGQLEMCTQTAAQFYGDVGYFDEYESFVLGKEEGDSISAALGSKRALILKHHGQLVVGASIADTVGSAVRLELVARLQLKAMASGTLVNMPDALSRKTHDFFRRPQQAELQWGLHTREILRLRPDILRGL